MKAHLAAGALGLASLGGGYLRQCAPDPTYHPPICTVPAYDVGSCKFSRQFEIEAGTPVVGTRVLVSTPVGLAWHNGPVFNIANQGNAEMTVNAYGTPYQVMSVTPIEEHS